MASSKFRFKKHSYKRIHSTSHSTRAGKLRFDFAIAKLNFRAIANFFPKNIQRDIESRIIKFYQDHPKSQTNPNSIYAYLACWYNIYAQLGLTSRKIASIFGMHASSLSANYQRYARRTSLYKFMNPFLAQLEV